MSVRNIDPTMGLERSARIVSSADEFRQSSFPRFQAVGDNPGPSIDGQPGVSRCELPVNERRAPTFRTPIILSRTRQSSCAIGEA